MLSVIMLRVVMLSVIMLSVILPKGFMLSVVVLSCVILGGYYAEWRYAECRYAECHGADLATSLTFDNLSQFWPFLVWMRMTHLETVGLTKERSFLGSGSSFYFEQFLINFLMIF